MKLEEPREDVQHIDSRHAVGRVESSKRSHRMPRSLTQETGRVHTGGRRVRMRNADTSIEGAQRRSNQTPTRLHKDRSKRYRRRSSIELNCNSTRLAVIDLNGVLSFHNLQASFQKEEDMVLESSECKRKDVWNMKWADDNPDLLAVMEKSRMYIIRGTEPEEPVSCTAYLCKFHDLQIHAVQLDEVMKRPEQAAKEHVFHYETKSLRDTHEILHAVKLQDAFSYVEEHSHPRLWITLAEHALRKLDLSIAERAFVKCQNYHGVQFVKGLYSLKEKSLQQAEVCFYFKKFDEAERIYLDMQRKDLAIDMRMRLGDWFMVERLVQSEAQTDSLMETLWNNIGNVLVDRKDWRQASKYYANAKNHEKLVECLYSIEDWKGLELVMNDIPNGHKLLLSIGHKFLGAGICEHAVTSFVRGGDVKSAIESCIELNNWDKGFELARQYNYGDFMDEKLKQFTDNLIFSGNHLFAFEVFKQAGKHLQAASVLKNMAAELALQKVEVQWVKKIYVLAALELDIDKVDKMSFEGSGPSNSTQRRSKANVQSEADCRSPRKRIYSTI